MDDNDIKLTVETVLVSSLISNNSFAKALLDAGRVVPPSNGAPDSGWDRVLNNVVKEKFPGDYSIQIVHSLPVAVFKNEKLLLLHTLQYGPIPRHLVVVID